MRCIDLFPVVGVLVAGGGAAAPVDRTVLIPGKSFAPAQLTALVGDTITWRNDDASTHTVTADDLAFDSGPLSPTQTFSRTFDVAGVYAYHCTIHRFMRGRIDVVAIVLKGPGYAVPVGVRTALKGLAPVDAGTVVLRRLDASGPTTVATVPVANDGSFRFPLAADRSATYAASADGLTSHPARIVVAARLTVKAVSAGRRTLVEISTAPAQPRARVQLENYLYERFTYEPIARARLDRLGHVTVQLQARRKLHIRAYLPRGVDGYGRAFSRTIVIPARHGARPRG